MSADQWTELIAVGLRLASAIEGVAIGLLFICIILALKKMA